MIQAPGNIPQNIPFFVDQPTPHGPKQKFIMEFFGMKGVQLFVACGTKYGKTISAAAGITKAAESRDLARWRWVAPIYSQARIGYEYCKRLMPPAPLTNCVDGKLLIDIPHLNSSLSFFHAQNPESLEGYGIAGYVFDEAAKMKETVYAAAKTTTTRTRAPMGFFSTPLGKNWFYKRSMEAKEEMLWAFKNGKVPTKLFITARTIDNPHIPIESIIDSHNEMPERLFRQYYLAEFMDDGSVFVGIRDCVEGPTIIGASKDSTLWIHPKAAKSNVVIGADWAKTTDYTVFVAICTETKRVVGVRRFNKKLYTEAIRELILFTQQFKEVEIVRHDKTGVGQAIDDQLSLTDLAFEGVTFTNSLKTNMVNRLITTIEHKNIILPNWGAMLDELDAFEVHVNDLGTMIYNAPSGQHDDIVCALMLAHAAMLDYSDRTLEVKYLEDLTNDMLPKKKAKSDGPENIADFYAELSGDNDDY